MSASRPHRWWKAAANIAVAACLLVAASFLPPDTSLSDRKASGVLKLCVPPAYPPLVTGNRDQPGFDVELARAIAEKLGLRLVLNVLPSIGQDFNPRNWFLTRAQCDMVGGGVADTAQTRSFLQTLPTGAETGWVLISQGGGLPSQGGVVAVLPGTSGLDRVALSSWMRGRGLKGRLAANPEVLGRMLASGTVETAVTERFVASALDLEGFDIRWLDPAEFPAFPMAFGLWKGDQTLMRDVRAAFADLRDDGTLKHLLERYGVDAADLDESSRAP